MQLPTRSVLAGGISSIAVWVIGVALAHFGIIVPPELLSGAVAIVGALATHLTPDTLQDTAKQLNVDVKSLAEWIPTVEYTYPDQDKK